MLYVPGALKSLDSYWLAKAIYRKCAAMHRARPLDLIDAHFGYPEGVGCSFVARRLRVPLFITIRGFEAEFIHRPLVGKQIARVLSSATGIIAVSHSLRRLAVEHGVAPDNIRVIHNAIDPLRYKYGDQLEARRRIAVTASDILIVSVGHLVPRKRHHVLLQAFSEVVRKHPRARLAIIGSDLPDPAYSDRLRRDVLNLGLTQSVSMLGNMAPEKVVDWLQASDVFALGTAREGCCNAVLEALAAGAPVVTTPVGDNAAFVKHGKNGFIVPVDDAHALSAAISIAVDHAGWDRRKIAEQLAAQVGGWEDVAARVLQFFRERIRQG